MGLWPAHYAVRDSDKPIIQHETRPGPFNSVGLGSARPIIQCGTRLGPILQYATRPSPLDTKAYTKTVFSAKQISRLIQTYLNFPPKIQRDALLRHQEHEPHGEDRSSDRPHKHRHRAKHGLRKSGGLAPPMGTTRSVGALVLPQAPAGGPLPAQRTHRRARSYPREDCGRRSVPVTRLSSLADRQS